MASLEVELIPALSDNYIYLIFEPQTGTSGVVDPALAAPVAERLEQLGRGLDYILATHHHADHTGGIKELKARYGAKVAGPMADAARIPGIDRELTEGDRFEFGALKAEIFETPGHTSGHIIYWFDTADTLFSGDTLFALGCGRLFEDSAEAMWGSLSKILQLPDETRIYCGHEYTQSNAQFALTVDPDNPILRERAAEIETLRHDRKPTIPSTLGLEKSTNPFLRPHDPAIRHRLRMPDQSDSEVFAEIRRRKDQA